MEFGNEYNLATFGPHGWICPKCGRCFSPSTPECPYCGDVNIVTTVETVRLPETIVGNSKLESTLIEKRGELA